MNYRLALTLLPLILGPTLSPAAELKAETLRGWDHYIQEAKARMISRLSAGSRFLWVDQSPDRVQRVRNGEIVVSPVNGNGRIGVPQGLIHDCVGAVFIPNTTVEKVFATLNDYGRYKELYRPTVVESKLISQKDTEHDFAMTWVKTVLTVTAVVDVEFKSTYFRKDEKSWYGFAWSTRIQEIVNYGQSTESNLPPGIGSGYVWRLYSISRFEQRDGGVYVELEEIVLSRCVPTYLEWLINPVVSRLSRSALVTSLSQTREAVRVALIGPPPQRQTVNLAGSNQ
jgi:hypothetical protein